VDRENITVSIAQIMKFPRHFNVHRFMFPIALNSISSLVAIVKRFEITNRQRVILRSLSGKIPEIVTKCAVFLQP
jgi:hypothetical protein